MSLKIVNYCKSSASDELEVFSFFIWLILKHLAISFYGLLHAPFREFKITDTLKKGFW